MGAALALAGCDGGGEPAPNAAAVEANGASGVAPPPAGVADSLAKDPWPSAAPPAPQAEQQLAIPPALHGRWALEAADCARPNGAATGVMTVTADGLRFYESRARPAGNIVATADSFDAEFSFQGEGQTWQNRQRLRRFGANLLRTDGSQAENITYVRCP